MTRVPISRRRLLAGIVGAGIGSSGGLVLGTSSGRAYTNTTRLQAGGIEGLVLDWRETYNGATLTDTTAGAATVSPSGPALSLDNVLPGDSGSLSVRLRLDAGTTDGESSLAVEPELTVSLTGDRESPGIEEFVDATVWYDGGLFAVGALGGDNAERDPGERLVHPDASGSLDDVGDALEDGVILDVRPSVPGTTCLGANDAITVTFGWSFPPNQPGINAVQGDAIEFDVRFHAVQC